MSSSSQAHFIELSRKSVKVSLFLSDSLLCLRWRRIFIKFSTHIPFYSILQIFARFILMRNKAKWTHRFSGIDFVIVNFPDWFLMPSRNRCFRPRTFSLIWPKINSHLMRFIHFRPFLFHVCVWSCPLLYTHNHIHSFPASLYRTNDFRVQVACVDVLLLRGCIFYCWMYECFTNRQYKIVSPSIEMKNLILFLLMVLNIKPVQCQRCVRKNTCASHTVLWRGSHNASVHNRCIYFFCLISLFRKLCRRRRRRNVIITIIICI